MGYGCSKAKADTRCGKWLAPCSDGPQAPITSGEVVEDGRKRKKKGDGGRVLDRSGL